jgi:hypothetical protein
MKGLFTFLLAATVFGIFASSPALGGRYDQSYAAQSAIAGVVDIGSGTPAVIASSWGYGGNHRHYGGHYGRGDPYYRNHRHGYGPSHYYGSGYFYRPYHPHYPYYPYRHYYEGYYRPYGGHFGFSACFRSGGVRVCVNESYPYRYR